MINRIKIIAIWIINEITLKSNSTEEDIDTFFRWTIYVILYYVFYITIYHFDEYAVKFDQWGHQVLGWKLSDVPSPAKVSLHRLKAGALAGVGIFIATVGYLTALYRRIKIQITTDG